MVSVWGFMLYRKEALGWTESGRMRGVWAAARMLAMASCKERR